ncbi:MAG: metallopeptidase TldD-related protein, partial [Methanobacterium sp.]
VETMNAFYIKDGEIAYPVKKAMLSGNVFNALKHASASSMKTRQIGPFILPQIIVSKLRVVG